MMKVEVTIVMIVKGKQWSIKMDVIRVDQWSEQRTWSINKHGEQQMIKRMAKVEFHAFYSENANMHRRSMPYERATKRNLCMFYKQTPR